MFQGPQVTDRGPWGKDFGPVGRSNNLIGASHKFLTAISSGPVITKNRRRQLCFSVGLPSHVRQVLYQATGDIVYHRCHLVLIALKTCRLVGREGQGDEGQGWITGGPDGGGGGPPPGGGGGAAAVGVGASPHRRWPRRTRPA